MGPNVFNLPQMSTIYLSVVQCKSHFNSRGKKNNDFHEKGVETCTNNHSPAQGGPTLHGPYANVAVSIYIQAAAGFLWWLCIFNLKCISSPRSVERPEERLETMFLTGLKGAFLGLFVVIFAV